MSPRTSGRLLSARTRNPTARSSPRFAPRPALPTLAGDLARVLYQHRIATTAQLHRLLTPDAADASYLRRVLRQAAAGLVDAVRSSSAGHRAWFLSSAGYAAAEASGEVEIRAHRMTPALAAGGLLRHRLAVVDAGTAFVTAARRSPGGDVCTPWAWAPEVLLQPGQRRGGGGALIADAVLRYERVTDDGRVLLYTVLIEVDRGSYPVVRLARKVSEYAAWWRTPHRRTVYPAAQLLIVVDMPPVAAGDRIRLLGGLLRREPAVASSQLSVGGVTLSALTTSGPWAPVFVDALDETETPVDVGLAGR